jgi:hypothetical protein
VIFNIYHDTHFKKNFSYHINTTYSNSLFFFWKIHFIMYEW